MDLKLQGKKVLVTGGSKGIGLGIAAAFLREGADTAVAARGGEALQEAAALYPGLRTFQADVMQEAARTELMDRCIADMGQIDILINNAGGSAGGATMDTSLRTFEEAMQLNFFSAVHLSKLAAEDMQQRQEGSIINISSIFGRESGGKPTYNSAKAAMISHTKSLADELITSGIRVNGIAPGSILHPTGNWQKRLDEDPEKIQAFVEREIPAGRFGTVEEIADTAVFLASPRASWIVGASLNVDGGQSNANF
ncbi:SDR family NAD(P)-dependent oxidoreductase [Alkalicoccus chagannorensis]|uniref:SDR family NAD(P)-dependent oxidoreductase n=1 Tax=Alkalicoccus chagannorensis TaxID=427072 RepID=UPI000427FAB5|nr:SDR family oxidoreductase [Alkalicoccus chagannorensis]